MKRVIFLFLISQAVILNAQNPNYCITDQVPTDNTPPPCCNANINTDYNYPFNPERSDLLNQFNWLTPATTSTGAATIKINRNGSTVSIEHPFLNDLTKYYWYSNYRIGHQSPFLNNNMHPKYGWQLLYHNFGFDIFTTNPASNVPASFNPIMIYYNKHTGKMRVFSSPAEGNSFDESTIRIGFVPSSSGNSFAYSGLFSHNTAIARALDQKTDIEQVTASLPFANVNTWVGTDIQTTYDPCICKRESRLKFDFFDQDMSKVYMSGNIVGINRPLDNSGNSPLKFGENFISSVYANYTNSSTSKARPTSGMLVYNDINQIVANSYVSQPMKDLATALDLIASVSGGLDLAGLPLGAVIGFGLSFASKAINPSVPQISFLEAQGAFSGEINNQTNSGGYSSFEILNPGSFHNYRKSIPWTLQPLYNESLGIFALLKTPKLVYNTMHTNPNDGSQNPPYDNDHKMLAFTLKEPLVFVLNPSSEVDIDKTKIHAAIEFDLYDQYNIPTEVLNQNNQAVYAKDYFKPTFVQLSPENLEEDVYNSGTLTLQRLPSDKKMFASYIMPINKLHNVAFVKKFKGGTYQCWQHSGDIRNSPYNPKFRLRIYADYVFKPNQYGEVNKTVQSYLYDIDVELDDNYIENGFPCSVASNIFCGKKTIDEHLGESAILGTTNYSTSQVLYYNNLDIVGHLTTSNNAKVILYYRGRVTTSPTSSISPDITIAYNDFDVFDGLTMASESYLKNEYCASAYKANQLDPYKSVVHFQDGVSRVNLITTLSLHPNPTSDKTVLTIENPVAETAQIAVYDMLGREVLRTEAIDVTDQNKIELATESLERGIYVVKVIHGNREESLKLEILK